MKDLPTPARFFVGAVLAAGALVLAIFAPHAIANLPLFAALLLLSSLASAFKVSLPLASSGSTMSVSYAVDFAALLLLGADETMLVAAASAWSQCTFRTESRTPPYRTLFSIASLLLTVKAAGLAYGWLGGAATGAGLSPFEIAKPLVGAATTYFVFNTAFIATAIALSTRQRIFRVWNENFLWSAPSYFFGAGAAAIAAWVVGRGGYWMALLTAAPVYLHLPHLYKVYMGRIQDQQRHARRCRSCISRPSKRSRWRSTPRTRPRRSHIRRVQAYAAASRARSACPTTRSTASRRRRSCTTSASWRCPSTSSSKPGPLTQEEFQKVRIHPQVGADIIAGVPFPYPVAPLILSHHERWDGAGYPSGLKGEEIPLGARILCVVDYFDALMSDRPYHKAIGLDAALALLRQEPARRSTRASCDLRRSIRGSRRGGAERGAGRKLSRVPRPRRRPARPSASSTVGHRTTSSRTSRSPIGRSTRSTDRAGMGSSLGVSDTMGLISSKLSDIVPFSSVRAVSRQRRTEASRAGSRTGTESERSSSSRCAAATA